MSTMYRYALPVEQTKWKFDGKTETCFTWEYDDQRAALLQLYDKGKKQQWDAAERIDWSLDLDPENPMMLDDRVIPIFGTDVWKRMTEAERRRLIEGIAQAPPRLRAAVEGLLPEQLDTPYRPGGWTVRQVVHHLPDSHLNAYVRLKLALTENEPPIKTYE